MCDNEISAEAKLLWNRLSIETKKKLLSYFQYKDEYSHFEYEDLPQSILSVLWLKIEKNYPKWLQ
jgi:hypothetical protein